eukprot:TRINITY_DN3607_c0_g2_i1.p1 TRINITY_DN3607_c0_g2~~TRINITY_DN3607_c0_g2_i1.p1  ORF type:complete len:689 (+),score=248.88 TRINITY_DN3607_c0_g2_i1:119-2185(+)
MVDFQELKRQLIYTIRNSNPDPKIIILTLIAVFGFIVFFSIPEHAILVSRSIITPRKPTIFELEPNYSLTEIRLRGEITHQRTAQDSVHGMPARIKRSGGHSGGYEPPNANITRYADIRIQGKQHLTYDSIWVTLDAERIMIPHDTKEVVVVKYFLTDQQKLTLSALQLEISNNQPYGAFVLNITILQGSNAVMYEVVFAALLLVFVYTLIIFEVIHRTITALLGSFLGVTLLSVMRVRPTFVEVVSWIDFDTIGLLFGMMVMVGILADTGFFEWCAIKAYRLSGGNIWYLMLLLLVGGGCIGAFLDNVTIILLITPVTIRLCQVMEVDPKPFLLGEIFFANIVGTSTAIGDPPNIIIVSDARIKESGLITFTSFTLHMGLGVLLMFPFLIFYWKWYTRNSLKRDPTIKLRVEIEVWKHALGAEDNERVRDQLNGYIEKLEAEAAEAAANVSEVAEIDIDEYEKKYRIHDIPLFIKSSAVLTVVIIFFFIHSFIAIHISLAWIAIIGCIVHLVISGIRDITKSLRKVEFGTLLFFAALFVLMRTLEELGLMEYIGNQSTSLIRLVPEGDLRLTVAIMLILWVSAIFGAFIDNIPFTTTMIPIVYALAKDDLGLPLAPITWALVYGVCFGGNGTLIGASANVVGVGLASQSGINISFNEFFKAGFPFMIFSVACANVYLLVSNIVFKWY